MTVDKDVLLAYVMGTLDPGDEHIVVAHLREHPADAAWVRAMLDTKASLTPDQEADLAQEDQEMPADNEQTVLERIRAKAEALAGQTTIPDSTDAPATLSEHPPGRSRWAPWLWLSFAAGLALVAWFGLGPSYRTYAAARQLDNACSEPNSSCVPLLDNTGETLGTLAQRSGGELLVVLEAPPPEDRVYQAWLIANTTPRALGTWSGRVLTFASPSEPESLLAVSIEPAGGSAQPTVGPIFITPLNR